MEKTRPGIEHGTSAWYVLLFTSWVIWVDSASGTSIVHPLHRSEHRVTFSLLNLILHGLILRRQRRLNIWKNLFCSWIKNSKFSLNPEFTVLFKAVSYIIDSVFHRLMTYEIPWLARLSPHSQYFVGPPFAFNHQAILASDHYILKSDSRILSECQRNITEQVYGCGSNCRALSALCHKRLTGDCDSQLSEIISLLSYKPFLQNKNHGTLSAWKMLRHEHDSKN